MPRSRARLSRCRSGLLITVALAVFLSACGSEPASRLDVAQELNGHLTSRGLSVKWVACAPAPERVANRAVYRCNVNFGDPHVVIYCAAVLDGELLSAEWRLPSQGRQDREAAARECAGRLGLAR